MTASQSVKILSSVSLGFRVSASFEVENQPKKPLANNSKGGGGELQKVCPFANTNPHPPPSPPPPLQRRKASRCIKTN